MTASPRLILASASPRRRALLETLGIDFSIRAVDVDESRLDGETPAEYVLRIARVKASAHGLPQPGCWILGADTTVELDGVCLGKPDSAEAARGMLERLSGRVHRVYSAVALAGHAGTDTKISVSRVEFASLATNWIDAYVACGEPMDKAGAYAIQGRAAAWIRSLQGSHSGVVGLPLFETASLLRRARFDV